MTYADDECLDGDGEPWPEHDYNEWECRRCGAELYEEVSE